MGCCSVTAPDLALRAATSRFLKPGPFVAFKGLFVAYFLIWCFLWPLDYTSMYLFATYWVWYTGTAYFALSFATACAHFRRWSAATQARAPDNGSAGGGSDRPGPSWSNLTGDVSTPALRTRIHPLEQAVLAIQLFTWNVACLGSLFVAIIYWSSLYTGTPITSVDMNAHTLIAFVMVADQMLVATPFRIRDMWKAEVFAITYLVYSLLWYFLEQELIYVILDWDRHFWEAFSYSVAGIFVLIPATSVLHYYIFRLRESIYATCRQRAEASSGVLNDRLLSAEDGGSSTQSESVTSHVPQTGTDLAAIETV
ncbi:conserved unknown protein [Ectocarpus siliculosus]|uniref:Uncharacterized protein n=1 Tax=Ectocarpus siliculosus TaxID=2880 RepID=D7G736_ECTSI|nr:conserved unknown protein [Ectocarpus siliculosus]|eukprot:CBJ25729.1 conserved unknown protein [Ectocarpus siliculosus]